MGNGSDCYPGISHRGIHWSERAANNHVDFVAELREPPAHFIRKLSNTTRIRLKVR
jgi:hypothetical protein